MGIMAQTKKYLMFISYLGSAFRGSQIQLLKEPNSRIDTVQSAVEEGLKSIFKLEGERPIKIWLASRTDSGVHALKAAIHVSLPVFKCDFLKPDILVKLLNYHFSKSKNIRVIEAHLVPDSFAFNKVKISKTYLYRLGILKEEYLEDYQKRVLPILETDRTYLLRYHKPFDMNRAQEAAYLFEGTKDFGAVLGRPSKNIRSTICNIISFNIQESQPLFPSDPLSLIFRYYHFLCKGDRFLYLMVRRMVALTLSAGFGRLNLKDIQKLFDQPQPSSWPHNAINCVPAHGLYLSDTTIDLENFVETERLSDETKNEVLNSDNENMNQLEYSTSVQ